MGWMSRFFLGGSLWEYECSPLVSDSGLEAGLCFASGAVSGYRHRTGTPLCRVQVYAKGGLRFLPQQGQEYTYEAMLERILAEGAGKAKYVVIMSGGNDVYAWKNGGLEELYEDLQLGVAIANIAARLWYHRIPGLFVFGGSANVWQYFGRKALVFDRRVNSVRRLAQRILSAGWLPFRVVSGVEELWPLRGAVVDGIGHYAGTEDAFNKLTRALADFCMQASFPRRSRL